MPDSNKHAIGYVGLGRSSPDRFRGTPRAPAVGVSVRRKIRGQYDRRDTSWLFNMGAECYAWFTGQAVWRQSCEIVAGQLPSRLNLVLDIGCGHGVSTLAIARARPGTRVVGADRAARMLRLARRSAFRRQLARCTRWVQTDASRLPFADGTFDAVTAHSVLYLLPDRNATLAEIRRVLRRDGLIVAMEPAVVPWSLSNVLHQSRDPRFWLSAVLWRAMSRVHGRFDRSTLTDLLASAGFSDIRVERTVGGLGLLASAHSSRG